MLLGTALDGAISGLAAVLLMSVFETPFWSRFGLEGVVQWQVNEIIIFRILSKPYGQGRKLRWAIAMHLSHGIVLGALFAILLGVAFPSLLSNLYQLTFASLVYTVLLWMFVPFSLRSTFERVERVKFSGRGMTISLIAHFVYGMSLAEFLFILFR